MFRPFYIPDEPGAGGGAEAPVDFNDFSPASWDEVSETVEETEDTAEEVPAQVAAEPTAQGEPAEAQATETPTEPAEEVPAQVAAEPEARQETTWEEAIKSVDKAEVLKAVGNKREILKALGESDFIADLIDYYDANGNVDAYLEARAVDYDKIPDEEVIRRGIAKEYSDAPPSVLESFIKKELAKYEADEDDGQEGVDNANYLKKRAADKFRAVFKEEQAKFSIPDKEVKTEPVDPKKIIDQYEADKLNEVSKNIAEYEKKAVADERTKKLLANKSIAIAEGVNVLVENTDDVLAYTVGKKNFISLFQDKDGNPDLDRWYQVLAFALNPDGVIKAAVDHGKTLSAKQEIDEGGNATPPQGQSKPPAEESDWEALNKHGVVSRFY